MCERNNSADTKLSEEGGGEGAPGTRAEVPLQPVDNTNLRQSPCSPWGPQWSRPMEDPTQKQVNAQRRL